MNLKEEIKLEFNKKKFNNYKNNQKLNINLKEYINRRRNACLLSLSVLSDSLWLQGL